MSVQIVKMTLKKALESIGKEKLLQKLISGEIESEGILFQELMTEVQELAEDFQPIPRSAWKNYVMKEDIGILDITMNLDHVGQESIYQGYGDIFVLLPNTKESVAQGQKKTRVHEHHDFIGRIALKLRKEWERTPQAEEVWEYFVDNWEDIDHVIDMNDEQIVFVTSRGSERKIKKPTLINLVSEYLTGKKELL